jgi:presequence protease
LKFKNFKQIRKLAFGDLFQKKIKQYLLNNTHAAFLSYIPDENYTKELLKKEGENLSAIEAKLSELDQKNIEYNSMKLDNHQKSFQNKELLPKLMLEDIPTKLQNLQNFKMTKINDLEVYQNPFDTNGLTYVRIYRKISVPRHLIQLLPFFASVRFSF